MIVAVDTNVVLDCLVPDAEYHVLSLEQVRSLSSNGHTLVACEIVGAEVATGASDPLDAVAWMDWLSIGFDPLERDASLVAAAAWQQYRSDGGTRQRLVPDFLVGAHAITCTDALLTRDRGFQRRYFPDLVIYDPATPETQ